MSAEVVLTEKTLNDAALKAELQILRQTNNWTNIYYIAAIYLYLAAVIGGTIAFCEWQQAEGFSFFWNIPVVLTAIVLIGAGVITHTLAKREGAFSLAK